MSFPIIVSSSSAARLSAAQRFLSAPVSPKHEAPRRRLIISASRGAADDLARTVAARSRATFGIQRLSVSQLAARAAIVSLAAQGAAPSSWLGAEAAAARA